MKNQVIAVSLLIIASSVQFASAGGSDGTIRFTGAVTSATCSVSVNGNSTGTVGVTLPTVSTSDMTVKGSTKGTTALNFALSGCTPTTRNASVFFQGGSGVNADGTVANTAKATDSIVGATGIALQIKDASNTPVVIGSSSQLTSGLTTLDEGAAAMAYTVQYITTNEMPLPGAFLGAVTYSINYK